MRNFPRPADQCVTAAGYLADAADCRARPISDTILDTRCHGITNLRPVARASLQSGVRLWWWCQMNGQSVQLEPAQLRENRGNKSSDLKLAPLPLART